MRRPGTMVSIFAAFAMAASACVPIAENDLGPVTSTAEPTAVPPTPMPGAFSLDPPTPIPIPTPSPTPDPETIIGRAIITGSGQSGEKLIGVFDPSAPVPSRSAGMTLAVRLWIPENLLDGTHQPQASIVHSSRAERQNWIEFARSDGERVRLFLHPGATLKTVPLSEEYDRITDTFPPGGPSRAYEIELPFDLSAGEPFTFQFRVNNVGLSRLLVEAALELTQ